MPLLVSCKSIQALSGADNRPASERAETPPIPSALIPFTRDRDFVMRPMILDKIHQECSELGSWTALVGIGGVG